MNTIKLLYPKAKKYMKDNKRLIDLVSDAFKKITKLKDKEKRTELKGDFSLACNLTKDWANGTYKKIPTASLLKIIVAVIYFVMPIDLIPDFILGTGLLDDITVISFLLSSLKADLDDYKLFKIDEENNLTSDEEKSNIDKNEK